MICMFTFVSVELLLFWVADMLVYVCVCWRYVNPITFFQYTGCTLIHLLVLFCVSLTTMIFVFEVIGGITRLNLFILSWLI